MDKQIMKEESLLIDTPIIKLHRRISRGVQKR